MTQTNIQVDQMVFGAPALLTVDGVDFGATETPPKFTSKLTMVTPTLQGAIAAVAGTSVITKALGKLAVVLGEITAAKLLWAFPNATQSANPAVVAAAAAPGLDTTLAADPALGAVNLKVTSVTTVNVGDFLFVGPPSAPATTTAEVVQATTVGTTGSGGTGVGVVNDTGGGMRIDHANGERIATAQGTVLAANAAQGDTAVKVASVTNWNAGDVIRVGYLGRYETRTITVVGTVGNGGTGLQFLNPLDHNHAVGEWVIKVTGAGTTVTTPTRGRIPTTAHHTVKCQGIGLDGQPLTITLLQAIQSGDPEIDLGDDKFTGVAIEFEAYAAGSAIQTAPYSIETD